MGFQFIDAETRNPTPQPPSHEELQLAKLKDSCTQVEAKLFELEEFIDENRLLQKFYAWQVLREQMRDTSAEVVE
jgi:hypothetical protein